MSQRGDDTAAKWAMTLAVVLIFGAGTAAVALTPTGRILAVTGVAVALVVGLVVAATMRFEWFVVGLLVTRATLDVTDPGGDTVAKPASLVAVVMIVASAAWLLVNRRDERRRRWSAISIGFGGYVAIAAIGLLQLDAPGVVVPDVLALVGGLLMFLVVERLLMFGMPLSRLLIALQLAAIVPLSMPLVGRFVGVDTTHVKDGVTALKSTFVLSNNFAHFLVPLVLLAIPIANRLFGWRRWAIWLVVALASVELLRTNTRGAWIGVIVGVVVLGVLESRRLLFGMVIVTTLTLLTVPAARDRIANLSQDPRERRSEDSFDWRMNHWSQIIHWNEDRPLVGIGLGMVRQIDENRKSPHNDYVKAFVETGWIGLTCYLTFMFGFLSTAWRARRRVTEGWVGGLANGIFAFAMAFAAVSVAENLIASITFLWYAMSLAAIASWIVHNSPDHVPAPATAATPVPGRVHA